MEKAFNYFAAFIIYAGLSWSVTCMLIFLITACFELPFRWNIATGIWLCLILLGSVVRVPNSNKKQ